MRKYFIAVLAGCFLSFTLVAAAHPPSEIKLTYDPVKKNLNIDIKHVTKNPLKDRIRQVTVTKNKEAPKDFYFPSQQTEGLTMDVPMQVTAGDVIIVKAFASQGGTKEETLKIE